MKRPELKPMIVIAFCFLILGCNLKTPGTNTGNPEGALPVPAIEVSGIYKLAYLICAKFKNCYPEADTHKCYAQVIALNSYTSELGATGSMYATINELASAERSSAVTANTTNFDACEDVMLQVSCTDPLIQNNYTPASANQYAQTKLLFGASSSCSQIY